MKLSSLLNKRNYFYLYYKIKSYPRLVNNYPKDYSEFDSISNLTAYLKLEDYNEIAVVASGPSSNFLKKDVNTLYFSTNNSIKLVEELPFIYMVNDSFYLTKYLKSFKGKDNWKGTFFWMYLTDSIKASYGFKLLNNYIKTKSRDKGEFLICNDVNNVNSLKLHKEMTRFLKDKFNFDFYGVNSGFVVTALAFILAYHSNKNLTIYGLDMGENGEGYFSDKTFKVGASIKGDFSKDIVERFLDSIYKQSKIEIINKSYFKAKHE